MTTRSVDANAQAIADLGQPTRRWLVLGVGLAAMIAVSAAQYGLAFLIPALRADGLTLAQASLVVIAPVFGVLFGLLPWGYAADRYGERVVLCIGSAGAGLASLGAAAVAVDMWPMIAFLFVTGLVGASVHSASGRLILGWFSASERGLAMGARQTGQALGVALAAIALPVLAATSVSLALAATGVFCLIIAGVAALLISDPPRHSDPPRPVMAPRASAEADLTDAEPDLASAGPGRAGAPAASASPYHSRYLPRIHAASALLVIPQFCIAVFAFDYLVTVRGWPPADAGLVLAAAQICVAATRLLAGAWSDRRRNRLRPMRLLALVTSAVLASLAVAVWLGSDAAVVALALAAILTASTNGLAYTAVAERAGMGWAGRALGLQNTVQNIAAVATPPVLVAVIALGGTAAAGYGMAFGLVAILPALAAFVVPVRDERPI